MPYWAVQQIRVLIAPNSQIVMFITVAIDFLVQPKGQSARSSRNAVKQGLSVAITSDRASRRGIEVLARKFAQLGAGDSLGQARLAAEAEFELNRVRGAFEAVLTRAGVVGGGVDEAERATREIR